MRDPWFDKKGLDFEEEFARVRHERVSEVLGKVTPERWREQRMTQSVDQTVLRVTDDGQQLTCLS